MRMSDLRELVNTNVSEDEVVEICRDLVRAPSENPPGNEEAVARVASSWLQSLGLECDFVEPLPGRVSTISSWGAGNGPTLLFNGHYDVVPVPDPDAWPHPPFAAVVEDGKLYGRGSVDMKSGIAACLGAVSALQRAGLQPNGRLLMHLVADEEALGTHGTRFLVENGYCEGVTEALVGEPSDMHLVTSERGALWLRIVTSGRSAHGSVPQLGVSAIQHMARVVEAVYGMRFRKLHETLGAPTVNVGTIHGGSKVNMVADHCEIEIDRRTLPGETNEEILGEFEAVLAGLAAADDEFKARIELIDGAEASQTPEGTTMVKLLSEARDAFGVDASEIGYAGATDARFLINQGNIPSVVCGPGDLMQAHTTGEHVEISRLVDATRVYAYAFARFLEAT
jgi:acetylornithine deacetylase/succinyl-diaminopimelate desuccinylase family protein